MSETTAEWQDSALGLFEKYVEDHIAASKELAALGNGVEISREQAIWQVLHLVLNGIPNGFQHEPEIAKVAFDFVLSRMPTNYYT